MLFSKIEAGLDQPDPNRVLPCRVVARAKKVCFAVDRLLVAARFLKDSGKHVGRAARALAAQRSSGSDMLQRTWRVAVDQPGDAAEFALGDAAVVVGGAGIGRDSRI